MVNLSDAIKEAYATNPDNDIILNTIEILHPSFVDDSGNQTAIRLVLDNQNHYLRLENDAPLNNGEKVEFISCYFDFILPAIKENEPGQLQLSIDGVSREISTHIEQAKTTDIIKVIYRIYLLSNGEIPEMDPIHGSIQNISVNIFNISGTVLFSDFINTAFPDIYYSPKHFPGLINALG